MSKGILAAAAFTLILGTTSEMAFAYRPLATEDAGVAGKGVMQTELSWDYLKWNTTDKEHFLLFVPIYGATENLELSAEIPYLFHRFEGIPATDGVGDVNLVGKYLALQEGKGNPAFAVKAVIKLDNGDDAKGRGSGDMDYTLVAVSSKAFGEITVHAHAGYTWIGKEKDENLRDIYLYGLALDYGLTDSFHVVAEINGNRHPDKTENQNPQFTLLGVTYKITENLIADFGIRGGMTSTTPDWSSTAGLSITF